MVLPFTTDNSLFNLYLDALSTSLMPSEGKDTAGALNAIQNFLRDEIVPGTILFVTDGIEPHALPTFQRFVADKAGKEDILVMGVGTSQGGPVRTSGNRFLSDSSGRRIFAKLDVDALRSLKSMNISATTLTLDDDDIQWIQRRVQHHLEAVQQRDDKTRWINEGYWLIIPVTAIAALWFRKGWTVRWTSTALAALVVLPSPMGNLHFNWLDLWMTPDQQGRYYFEKSQYRKAAERYADPIWKGLALDRAGDLEGSMNAFALEDSAKAWYNQGNVLARLNRYPEAAEAYRQALLRHHPWPDAQENLELIQSLIPKAKKKDSEEEQEFDPNEPPDQVKFDEKGKKGKRAQIEQLKIDPAKMAEIWMRNIQTTPADFLRLRFAIQAAQERKR
jgi:Ca-activated chloride channel family protein